MQMSSGIEERRTRGAHDMNVNVNVNMNVDMNMTGHDMTRTRAHEHWVVVTRELAPEKATSGRRIDAE